MAVPIATCPFGHLIWSNRPCPQCKFEKMAAEILNQGFETRRREMDTDPPNYVEYYCSKCTARKRQGWLCCPFCASFKHYHYPPNNLSIRVEGEGIIKLHKTDTNLQTPTEGQLFEAGAQSAEQPKQEKVSSEEEAFESNIKRLRNVFDNLKRCRKDRKRVEQELADSVAKGLATECALGDLREQMDRIQRPQPFAVRNVYGQLQGSNVSEVLGIIRIEQGYPVCDITVRLPR